MLGALLFLASAVLLGVLLNVVVPRVVPRGRDIYVMGRLVELQDQDQFSVAPAFGRDHGGKLYPNHAYWYGLRTMTRSRALRCTRLHVELQPDGHREVVEVADWGFRANDVMGIYSSMLLDGLLLRGITA